MMPTRSQRLFDALARFGSMDCRQAAEVTHDDREYCSSTLSDMKARRIVVVDGYRRYPDAKNPLVRYKLAEGAQRPTLSRQAPRVVAARVAPQRAPEPVAVHVRREPLYQRVVDGRTVQVVWNGCR